MPTFASGGIVNTVFALVFAVNLLAIFWSLIMYFFNLGSQEHAKEFKSLIIGSVTSLFLLMCLFAIVDWIRSALGV